MRPVNLIPPEERRGERAPTRTGPLAYVVVAALAAALIAVTLSVLASNQISDRKAERAQLESQLEQAQREADRFKAFADFASVQRAREQTVMTLAESRFDWERVLRELAITIPSDVWLTSLSASVSAQASNSSTSSSTTSTSNSTAAIEGIAGPSLDIQGCADGHQAVARFIASLHDVGGVTRVTVLTSDRPDPSSSGAAASSTSTTGATGEACAARGFLSKFEVVAAFDAVQLAAPDASSMAPVPAATETTTTQTSASATASNDQSQVDDARQQLQQQRDSAAEKTQKGRDAVNTFVPGTGSAP